MLFRGTRCLFHAALNDEAPALQIGGKLGLQFPQTLAGINFVGVEPPIRRHRYMKKVHVRRLFIHVDHCGNDILRAHKLREKGFALLKETPCFLRREPVKKRLVRSDDKPAHAYGVLSYGFDQQEVVNTILNAFGIVRCCGFVELVVHRASFVVNIGIAVALPFPPVMALDAAYGFLLEFVHMEYEIGHGNTSLYQWMSRSFCGRNAGHFFSLRGTKVENMFGFGWTS